MRTFIFFGVLIVARACCPTCECHRVCQTPEITASMTLEGLNIVCNSVDCACVKDELDGCTYGGLWSNSTVVGWTDSRWSECIKVTQLEPLRASAILRWWDNSIKCMGHSILNIEANLIGIYRDVFVQFEQTVSYQHGENINNVFYVSAVSGSSDARAIVGQSTMYFNVEMNDVPGVHIEILNCTVKTTNGPNGEVLTENRIKLNSTQEGSIQGELNENKTSMTYTAFWDDVSNSPFHNLMCDYAIFNGTSLSTHPAQRKYMIADPNEVGVLWDDESQAASGDGSGGSSGGSSGSSSGRVLWDDENQAASGDGSGGSSGGSSGDSSGGSGRVLWDDENQAASGDGSGGSSGGSSGDSSGGSGSGSGGSGSAEGSAEGSGYGSGSGGGGSGGGGGSNGGGCDNTSDLHITIIQHDSHYSPYRRLHLEPKMEWKFGGEYTTYPERIGRFKNGLWYEGEDPMQVGMYVLFAWCLGIIFLVVMRSPSNTLQFWSGQSSGRRNRVFTDNKFTTYE